VETRLLTFVYPVADLGVYAVDICLWNARPNTC
jgi:hypothetical protein